MRDDDDDDDRLTPAEKFGWREGEREQVQREMAERQRQIDRERIMAEASKAVGARPPTGPTDALGRPLDDPRYRLPEAVTKRYSAPMAPAATSMTKEWADYIKRQLDQRDRVLLKAIAQVVVAEEKARASEIAALRTMVAELRAATPALTCDSTPRGFDLDLLRSEWRH